MKKLFEWVKASPDNLPPAFKILPLMVEGQPNPVMGYYDERKDEFHIKELTGEYFHPVRVSYLSPVEQEPIDEDEIWKEVVKTCEGFIVDLSQGDDFDITIGGKVIEQLKQSFIIKRKP